jgi:hypothetical protein
MPIMSTTPPQADALSAATKTALSKNWPAIGWVLALALVHGCLYAAITPPWQAPDENVHYEYLRGLVQTRTVFPLLVNRPVAVVQQVMESARLYRWWELVRLPTPPQTPLASTQSVFAARGGWSLYYRLSFPLYAIVSAWPLASQLYMLRLYSVGLQCLTVWLTYKLAQLIFHESADPSAWLLPVAAAFFVAILPQYTFISSSYNDDNLVPPLVAAGLYAILRGWSNQADYRWLGLASALTVLAALTKRTAVSQVVLMGLCLLAYAVVWLRSASVGKRALGALVVIGSALGGLAPVFLMFNPSRMPARLAILLQLGSATWPILAGYAREPMRLLQIDWMGPLLFLSISFWGWFGWLKAPLGTHLMEILRRVTLLLMVGCGLAWVRLALASRKQARFRFQADALLLLGLGLVLCVVALAAQFLIAPLVYALNGRYLFPFISAIGILAVWGWQAWWPARWKVRGIMVGLAMLCVVDFVAVALTMTPYFYS